LRRLLHADPRRGLPDAFERQELPAGRHARVEADGCHAELPADLEDLVAPATLARQAEAEAERVPDPQRARDIAQQGHGLPVHVIELHARRGHGERIHRTPGPGKRAAARGALQTVLARCRSLRIGFVTEVYPRSPFGLAAALVPCGAAAPVIPTTRAVGSICGVN